MRPNEFVPPKFDIPVIRQTDFRIPEIPDIPQNPEPASQLDAMYADIDKKLRPSPFGVELYRASAKDMKGFEREGMPAFNPYVDMEDAYARADPFTFTDMLSRVYSDTINNLGTSFTSLASGLKEFAQTGDVTKVWDNTANQRLAELTEELNELKPMYTTIDERENPLAFRNWDMTAKTLIAGGAGTMVAGVVDMILFNALVAAGTTAIGAVSGSVGGPGGTAAGAATGLAAGGLASAMRSANTVKKIFSTTWDVAKSIGNASKAARALKAGDQIADMARNTRMKDAFGTLASGWFFANGEAGVQAVMGSQAFMEKLEQEHFDRTGQYLSGAELEEAQKLATKVGNTTYGLNLPLIMMSNVIQFGSLMAGKHTTRMLDKLPVTMDKSKIIPRAVQGSTFKHLGKEFLLDTFAEGSEEFGQMFIDSAVQNWFDPINKDRDVKDYASQVLKDSFNEEGLLNFLGGALIGGVSGTGSFVANFSKTTKDAENFVKGFNASSTILQTNLQRLRQIEQQMKEASADPETAKSIEAEMDALTKQIGFHSARTAVMTGAVDARRDWLLAHKEIEIEEFNKLMSLDLTTEERDQYIDSAVKEFSSAAKVIEDTETAFRTNPFQSDAWFSRKSKALADLIGRSDSKGVRETAALIWEETKGIIAQNAFLFKEYDEQYTQLKESAGDNSYLVTHDLKQAVKEHKQILKDRKDAGVDETSYDKFVEAIEGKTIAQQYDEIIKSFEPEQRSFFTKAVKQAMVRNISLDGMNLLTNKKKQRELVEHVGDSISWLYREPEEIQIEPETVVETPEPDAASVAEKLANGEELTPEEQTFVNENIDTFEGLTETEEDQIEADPDRPPQDVEVIYGRPTEADGEFIYNNDPSGVVYRVNLFGDIQSFNTQYGAWENVPDQDTAFNTAELGGFIKTNGNAEQAWNEAQEQLLSNIPPNGVQAVTFSDPSIKIEPFVIDGYQWNLLSSLDRAKVLVNINGVIVPFYLTSGHGGKGLIPGWYPFFGMGKDGWLNKINKENMEEYYERVWGKDVADVISKVAQELNAFYGTDPEEYPGDKHPDITERPLMTLHGKTEDYINSVISITPISNDSKNPNLREQLKANIRQLGDEIRAAYINAAPPQPAPQPAPQPPPPPAGAQLTTQGIEEIVDTILGFNGPFTKDSFPQYDPKEVQKAITSLLPVLTSIPGQSGFVFRSAVPQQYSQEQEASADQVEASLGDLRLTPDQKFYNRYVNGRPELDASGNPINYTRVTSTRVTKTTTTGNTGYTVRGTMMDNLFRYFIEDAPSFSEFYQLALQERADGLTQLTNPKDLKLIEEFQLPTIIELFKAYSDVQKAANNSGFVIYTTRKGVYGNLNGQYVAGTTDFMLISKTGDVHLVDMKTSKYNLPAEYEKARIFANNKGYAKVDATQINPGSNRPLAQEIFDQGIKDNYFSHRHQLSTYATLMELLNLNVKGTHVFALQVTSVDNKAKVTLAKKADNKIFYKFDRLSVRTGRENSQMDVDIDKAIAESASYTSQEKPLLRGAVKLYIEGKDYGALLRAEFKKAGIREQDIKGAIDQIPLSFSFLKDRYQNLAETAVSKPGVYLVSKGKRYFGDYVYENSTPKFFTNQVTRDGTGIRQTRVEIKINPSDRIISRSPSQAIYNDEYLIGAAINEMILPQDLPDSVSGDREVIVVEFPTKDGPKPYPVKSITKFEENGAMFYSYELYKEDGSIVQVNRQTIPSYIQTASAYGAGIEDISVLKKLGFKTTGTPEVQEFLEEVDEYYPEYSKLIKSTLVKIDCE